MWPRTDGTVGPGAEMTASRRTKNAGLSGFVSFMKRKDAEAALREFDGFDWGGSILRVGWSKAVPIATKPMYGVLLVSPHNVLLLMYPLLVSTVGKPKDERSVSRSRSRSRDRRRSRSPVGRYRASDHSPGLSRKRSHSRSPRRRRSYSRSQRMDVSRSRSPRRRRSRSPHGRVHTEEDEAVTDTFIRAVAAEVKGHDFKYENSLCERERSNPKFAFLIDRDVRMNSLLPSCISFVFSIVVMPITEALSNLNGP